MHTNLQDIDTALAVLAARFDESKRYADVLQRVGRLNGLCATHYYNRVQAIEIERERLLKHRNSLLRSMMNDKPQKNY